MMNFVLRRITATGKPVVLTPKGTSGAHKLGGQKSPSSRNEGT